MKALMRGTIIVATLVIFLLATACSGVKITPDGDGSIVVEFENFAYEAPAGYATIYLGTVGSENITIIASGNSYIKGGNGGKGDEYGADDAWGGDGGYGGAGDGADGGSGGSYGPGSSGASFKAEAYANNKQYTLYDESKTWDEAKAFAESQGGYLVTITSEYEHKIITKILDCGGLADYYVGGYRVVDGQNVWAWINCEEFDYAMWADSQPDDCGGQEDCIGIYSDTYLLNDFPKSYKCGFIVEYDLGS